MKEWPQWLQILTISSPCILYLLYCVLDGTVKVHEVILSILSMTALFVMYAGIIVGISIAIKVFISGGF